jgi:tubulin epsilon
MPHEVITISVGQAGNQIGWRFWDLVAREAAANGAPGVYDAGTSTFFENFREDAGSAAAAPRARGGGGGGAGGVGGGLPTVASLFGDAPLASLRARAVLVDLEEGVVGQVLRAPGLGALFDPQCALLDVSGAGNNWACGYHGYGAAHRSGLLARLRRALEACDSPQSFFVLSSTGGGTGSGFGSYVLEACADEFPELFRFAAAVFPSEHDDVVTSPYNFALAFDKLARHADAVLPLENGALHAVVAACEDGLRRLAGRAGGAGAAAAAADAADALAATIGPADFRAALAQPFPSRGAAGDVPAFEWKDYAPRAFAALRALWGGESAAPPLIDPPGEKTRARASRASSANEPTARRSRRASKPQNRPETAPRSRARGLPRLADGRARAARAALAGAEPRALLRQRRRRVPGQGARGGGRAGWWTVPSRFVNPLYCRYFRVFISICSHLFWLCRRSCILQHRADRPLPPPSARSRRARTRPPRSSRSSPPTLRTRARTPPRCSTASAASTASPRAGATHASSSSATCCRPTCACTARTT